MKRYLLGLFVLCIGFWWLQSLSHDDVLSLKWEFWGVILTLSLGYNIGAGMPRKLKW